MRVAIECLKLKAKFFRGFADPTRLAILECLRSKVLPLLVATL